MNERHCQRCSAWLLPGDPDLCELCDLHAAERGLDQRNRDRATEAKR